MAEAMEMEMAMIDPNRSERYEQARRLVVERYSADRMVEDYERVYGTL